MLVMVGGLSFEDDEAFPMPILCMAFLAAVFLNPASNL